MAFCNLSSSSRTTFPAPATPDHFPFLQLIPTTFPSCPSAPDNTFRLPSSSRTSFLTCPTLISSTNSSYDHVVYKNNHLAKFYKISRPHDLQVTFLADLSVHDDLPATFQADLSVQDAILATFRSFPPRPHLATFQANLSVHEDQQATSYADLSI